MLCAPLLRNAPQAGDDTRRRRSEEGPRAADHALALYGVAGMHRAARREREPFLVTEAVSSRQAIVRGMLDQSLQGLQLESSRQAVLNLRRIAGLDDSVKRIFFPH